MPMKLIVGLGNPGKEYVHNRHNVGFIFLDFLATTHQLKFSYKSKVQSFVCKNSEFIFAKTNAMMNDSGFAVQKLISFYSISAKDLYLVHDDLDLNLGSYKVQFGVGPKVHNGVNSVEQSLKSKNFWRVRVGIENRDSYTKIGGANYVLDNFTSTEKEVLASVFPQIKL